jgi:hypothetical protein
VAKRVCTTERSSANSSATTSSAAAAIGESGTAVSATVRERADRISACATSIVVPERDGAAMWQARAGISEAANASVRP